MTRPLVIAHRGACRYAPENTLAAFRLAAEQGAHAIELDAKLNYVRTARIIKALKEDTLADGSFLIPN